MIFKNTSLVKWLILCSAFMLCFYGCIDYTSTREEREIKRTIGKTIHLEGDFIFVDSACVNTKLPYISPVKVVTTLDYNDCYECMLKPILGLERIITSIDSSDLVQLIAFVPNADVYRIQEALRRLNINATIAFDPMDLFSKNNKTNKLLFRNRTFIVDSNDIIVYVGNPIIRPSLIKYFLETIKKLIHHNGVMPEIKR